MALAAHGLWSDSNGKIAAPAASRDWCLFLDVDGTLLEIAETPSAVVVDRVAEAAAGRRGRAAP